MMYFHRLRFIYQKTSERKIDGGRAPLYNKDGNQNRKGGFVMKVLAISSSPRKGGNLVNLPDEAKKVYETLGDMSPAKLRGSFRRRF